ncbi:MAG: ketoacyl-ACP synthase III [Mariniblastus sp.]|nr:ketoacyl-ACP synthase III [Mariniblastus sp.]MDG2180898.1 ketoacyl-ACP synthase III [Mariniblastus sp.]
MKYAAVGPIAVHLPERIESNADLVADNPRWDMDLIASKTGIYNRHVAGPEECSSDLGVKAAEKLFKEYSIDRSSIDFLFFCTQTPDYPLPTTACLIQDRLGLPTNCGALDFNLGCSGYVYGLSLCDGLIRSGAAKRILFITAETYTKLIDKQDRTLRTIFGDGAAATLIESNDEPSLWAFKFGTDGKGANTLLATENGFRNPEDAISPRHRRRWKSDLYMDGPALINFTVGQIPGMLKEVLKDANMTSQDVGYYLFHQATYKMLSQLQQVMEVEEAKVPILLRDLGNTVSSTLPILINQMRSRGDMTPEMKNMLVGFGVGWSWAGCIWQDVARP